MTMAKSAALRLHEDPALFREAANFTAAQTRFAARLIEKDYFCSVLLEYLAGGEAGLVFRGGTCLAKVHAGFYRLSEDLDFLIPTPIDASRADRRARASEAKRVVAEACEALPGLHLINALVGSDESRQYTALIGYTPQVSPQQERIKIDVGLREPLLGDAIEGEVHTLLLDPVSASPFVAPFPLRCLSRPEAMAEKLRAALSRRDVAIRDFYDVHHAVHRLDLRLADPDLIELVRGKLAVPRNEPVDVSPARLAALRQQVAAELKPVLRSEDFVEFDVEQAFELVAGVAAAVAARA
jgi:predicted nucleotidyltransferase component of viral defense system